MNLDSEEKRLLEKLNEFENKTFSLENVIEIVLTDLNVINERKFQILRPQNKYIVGVSEIAERQENIFEIHQIESAISKALKLIIRLDKENYLHISKMGLIHGNPLLLVGNNDNPQAKVLATSDELLISNSIELINARISFKEKLSKFLANNYLTQDQLNYQNSSRLAETNLSNSTKLVWANIIGLVLSLAAIGFSYYTYKAAQTMNSETIGSLNSISSSTNTVKENLVSVSEKLSEIPIKLTDFSKTVDKLNSSIDTQQGEFIDKTNKLNESVIQMSNSISKYKENTDDYSIQLEKIVKQTDKQLKIWADQQSILKNEFSRRTELVIKNISTTFDTTENKCRIERFEIHNQGSIEADITTMLFYVDTTSAIMVKEFMGGLLEIERTNGIKKYTNRNAQSTIQPETYIFYTPPIYYMNVPKEKSTLKLQVFYSSKYDSGKKEFEIDLSKCEKSR